MKNCINCNIQTKNKFCSQTCINMYYIKKGTHNFNNKVCCLCCKKEITVLNVERHIKARLNKIEKEKIKKVEKYRNSLPSNCKFCFKECKNINSLKQHEIRCKKNEKHINQKSFWNDELKLNHSKIMKGKGLGNKHNEKTKEKLKEIAIERNKRIWTDDLRLKHSKIMKEVAKNNPDKYSNCNYSLQRRAKSQKIFYNNSVIELDSSWEFYTVCYLYLLGINFERNLKGFEYIYLNEKRTYYPDFFLPELNCYIEVKGIETDRDKAKFNNFKENLLVFRKKEIEFICKIFNVKL